MMKAWEVRAQDDFQKARNREILLRVLALLRREKQELLSLQEVRSLIRPEGESYHGVKAVPVARIVGSEGRYQDFNKYFLPRRQHLRKRWVRVDMAHHGAVNLPPVKLYEFGGGYFVRDGNHRVSVARLQGVEYIDAEVISLRSRFSIHPGMSMEELKRRVIALEKQKFFKATGLSVLRPGAQIDFSTTGRYDEINRHIEGHKYFLNQTCEQEMSYEQALLSWYDTVFEPIVTVILSSNLLARFPGRTVADLYVWSVRHWDALKKRIRPDYPIEEAVSDFGRRYGLSATKLLSRWWQAGKRIFRRPRK
jgi:hypothetical protein